MSATIISVTDATFESQVVKAEKPVLVDFWADWCGPCKMLAPILEGLATEYGEKIIVAKLNVDENPQTPGTFGIMGIPTLLMFKNGQNVGKSVGYKSAAELKSFIDSNL
ncbi:MAG: thioredoxin [Peptococcaceae bacterium]|nr:thioredoxin [Peptococcaceae bacterium]